MSICTLNLFFEILLPLPPPFINPKNPLKNSGDRSGMGVGGGNFCDVRRGRPVSDGDLSFVMLRTTIVDDVCRKETGQIPSFLLTPCQHLFYRAIGTIKIEY